MTRTLPLTRVLALAVVMTGLACQPVVVPPDVPLTCDPETPCPEGQVCSVPDGLCVDVLDSCIFIDGTGATRLPDGAACDGGGICLNRACVAPRCGDGIVTGPETCDSPEDCRADCTFCGDGIVDAAEACDLGALNSATTPGGCRLDCRPFFCGDGVIDPGETCDGQPGCRDDCSFCGDATVDDGEECDSGDGNDDDLPNACRPIDCVLPRCGDDVVDDGEACDEGAANSDEPDRSCRVDCRVGGCGDGIIDSREACDGTVFPPGVVADRCSDDCRELLLCGDGRLQQANNETCDDGNDNPIDGCDACRGQRLVVEPVVSNTARARLEAATAGPVSVAVDRDGVIYIAESIGGLVRRLSREDGVLVNDVIAGTGAFSSTGAGDGGPALLATFGSPTGIALDRFGNLYVAEAAGRVRRINREGIITTVAGGGVVDLPNPGITLATDAAFVEILAVAVDAQGFVYFADPATVWRIETGGRLRRIYTPPTGNPGPGDDLRVRALAFDGDSLLVSEFGDGINFTTNNLVRMTRDGTGITTVIDQGLTGVTAIAVAGPEVYLLANPKKSHIRCVDAITRQDPFNLPFVAGQNVDDTNPAAKESVLPENGTPTAAFLNDPRGVALAPDGDIIITETRGHFVRRVDADFVNAASCGTVEGSPRRSALVRRIEPLIGDGTPRDANEGGEALTTGLVRPLGIQIVKGEVVIADNEDHRLRAIGTDGVIATIFGKGQIPNDIDDDVNRLFFPRVFVEDGADGFFVAGATEVGSFYNQGNTAIVRLRRTAADTLTREFAVQLNDFSAGPGFEGTDMPVGLVLDGDALLVSFSERASFFDPVLVRFPLDGSNPLAVSGTTAPRGMVRRPDGGIVIADAARHQILLLEGDTVTPIVGTGTPGSSGDGGNPLAAELNGPEGVALGADGALYIADTGSHRIRVVRDNVIETVAGTGVQGSGGDGRSALQAQLDEPRFIAVDAADRVVVVDETRRTIRRIDNGVIDTIAGRVEEGFGATSSARIQSRDLLALPFGDRHELLSLGAPGRISQIIQTPCLSEPARDCAFVEPVVAGSADEDLPSPSRPAVLAATFDRPGGMVFDDVGQRLIVADARGLRAIALDPDEDGDIDDPSAWTSTPLTDVLTDQGLGGVAVDTEGNLLVVRTTAHCVERFTLSGDSATLVAGPPVLGDCGRPGSALADLFNPSDVVVGAAGSIYVSDTGNNRVLRRRPDGVVEVVIGESGDPSSSGEGPSAARTFAILGPRQLDLDRFGNLYIAATSRLRVVTNTGFRLVPGLADDDLEPDGNDGVLNLYGGGDVFPEPETRCIEAAAVVDAEDDANDGVAWVNDICFAQVARVRRVTID